MATLKASYLPTAIGTHCQSHQTDNSIISKRNNQAKDDEVARWNPQMQPLEAWTHLTHHRTCPLSPPATQICQRGQILPYLHQLFQCSSKTCLSLFKPTCNPSLRICTSYRIVLPFVNICQMANSIASYCSPLFLLTRPEVLSLEPTGNLTLLSCSQSKVLGTSWS